MSETQGEEKATDQSAGARLAARRAAKAARKAAKRGTGPEIPDEVTQGVAEASSWLDEHQKEFWGSLAVVSVIGIVFLSFMLSGKKVDSDATADLSGGITTAMAPLGEAPPDDDGTVERFATAEERAARALEQYRDTQRKFPDSTAALFAKLGEANALRTLGKPEDAQKIFAKLAKVDGAPPVLQAQAIEGLAFSLEAQDNFADAAKQFAALSKIQAGHYRVPGEYHRARMLMAQGKADEAVKTLTDLVAADADRKDANGAKYDSVIETAQLLLQEWGAGAVRATPRPTPGGAAPAPTAAAGVGTPGGLTQQMVDSLREQLQAQGAEAPQGEPGLTKEIVEALQAQVAEGKGDEVGVAELPPAPAPKTEEPAKAEAVEVKPAANPAAPKKAEAAPAPAKKAEKAEKAPAKKAEAERAEKAEAKPEPSAKVQAPAEPTKATKPAAPPPADQEPAAAEAP